MSRRESQRGLTVGDGFRIGIGIAFWMWAGTMVLWALLTVGLLSLAALGA